MSKQIPHPPYEVKINYTRPILDSMYTISNADDVYDVMKLYIEDEQIDYKELFFVLLLTTKHSVLGISEIGRGNVKGVVVNFNEIFQLALLCHATQFIVVHNHCSGNLKASDSDIQVTKKLKQAGELLDIQLVDHLIITSEGYLSFANEGLL